MSAELTPLVDAASLVRSALAPLPAGTRFEAQLAWRLTHPGTIARLVSGSLRHPARLLISGAVSSLAVGIGITLLALRRGSRRRADIAARPAHR